MTEQVEKQTMSSDWKSQNEYRTKKICRFNKNSIKLPMAFFTELKQNKQQKVWKCIRSTLAKAILTEKKGAGKIRFSDFRLYYKASVIKVVWTKTKREI